MPAYFPKQHVSRGFSLVEVVITVGIVSFALVVIVGLFGTLLSRQGEVKERNELVAAIGALNTYIDQEISFEKVYSEIAEGTLQLDFAQYRVDDDGLPSRGGTRLNSQWFAPDAPIPSAVEAAREGRLIKARIRLDTDRNPVNPLTGNADSYSEAMLALVAQLYPVPDQNFSIPEGSKPIITIPLAVLR